MASLPIRACLFDLDGTLVDTAADLGHAANRVRADHGLHALPLADYRDHASAGARGLLGVALGMTPDHAHYPACRDRFLAYYRADIAQTSQPFPGIPGLLLALQDHGIRWGVVTNKPGWLTQPLMHHLGLAQMAACIVSGDSAARPKPAPDPLFLACAQIALTPGDCVYVGDDPRDIDSARAAGMRSVAAGWGYVGAGIPLKDWGADEIADTVDVLLGLLIRPRENCAE